MFKRTYKYTILKVLSYQVLFQNFRHHDLYCCVKPTSHNSATLSVQIPYDNVNEYVVQGNRTIYLFGKECQLNEDDQLEFKLYKVDLLIKSTVIDIVLIFRIQQYSRTEGKILKGISYYKDLNDQ